MKTIKAYRKKYNYKDKSILLVLYIQFFGLNA